MPQIDIGPNEYRKLDPKTGRWNVPDDPKFGRLMFFGAAAFLVFIFMHRSEFSSGVLFGVSSMFSFVAGGMFMMWMRDRY